MSARRTHRRGFLKGAAGIAAVGVAGLAAGCAPSSTPAPTGAAAPTAAPTSAPAVGATAAPTAAATTAASSPTAAAAVTSVPNIKYANQAAVFRYITGGFTQAGPDDALIEKIQEDALRKEYGLNVKISFESAGWNDVDRIIALRVQTQAIDGLQRDPYVSVLQYLSTPGLTRDIDQVVKEYGKNLISNNPTAGWQYFMPLDDQSKYVAIPTMRVTPADVEYIHIRRDWLDKINRDIPTTIEELEEALRLFKQKNLGGDITLPFNIDYGNWLMQACITGPFDPEPDAQFKLLADGKNLDLAAQFNEERLDLFQRWFKDGLLNKEYATWKIDQVYEAAAKGYVGAISGGWWDLNGMIQQQVIKADPKQDWVQIFPPVARKGVPNTGRIRTGQPLDRGIIVMSWAQAPEAVVALADWEMKSFDNYMVGRFGIEGKHWKYGSNGSIIDLRSPAPKQEYSGMRATDTAVKWNIKVGLLPPPPGNEPIDPEIIKRVYKSLYTRKVANVPEQGEYPAMGHVDRYLGYRHPKSATKKGDMDSIAQEYFTKIVKGQMSIAAGVKEFTSRWLAAGGDIYQQEITDQYNEWIKSHPEWKDPKATLAPEYWNTKASYPERKKQ